MQKAGLSTALKVMQASPDYLASTTLNKLIFGDNILAIDASGTEASVECNHNG